MASQNTADEHRPNLKPTLFWTAPSTGKAKQAAVSPDVGPAEAPADAQASDSHQPNAVDRLDTVASIVGQNYTLDGPADCTICCAKLTGLRLICSICAGMDLCHDCYFNGSCHHQFQAFTEDGIDGWCAQEDFYHAIDQ